MFLFGNNMFLFENDTSLFGNGLFLFGNKICVWVIRLLPRAPGGMMINSFRFRNRRRLHFANGFGPGVFFKTRTGCVGFGLLPLPPLLLGSLGVKRGSFLLQLHIDGGLPMVVALNLF